MSNVAGVVLAAGGSSRMGRPKQLLPFAGTSLVRYVAGIAVSAGLDPVFVVIGANAGEVRTELSGLVVTIVSNPDWEFGPGTSVRVAADALESGPDPPYAAVFLLCDQPFVTPGHIRKLVAAHADTGRPIAASGYGGTVGVPALFARACFAALRAVDCGAGAKRVIARDPARVAVVPFPAGEIDLDTPADYVRWSAARPDHVVEEPNGAGQ